jgi:hypothetical protein
VVNTVLTTIPGEYDNGQIRLSGAPPVVRWARVLVTFLEEGPAAVAPAGKRTVADGLAALGSLSLTEEEERILDDLESFRESHPFDLRSLAEGPV